MADGKQETRSSMTNQAYIYSCPADFVFSSLWFLHAICIHNPLFHLYSKSHVCHSPQCAGPVTYIIFYIYHDMLYTGAVSPKLKVLGRQFLLFYECIVKNL